MSAEKSLEAFAGVMVLLSLALTHWVSPLFFWFTVFIGFNLVQQAFTGFCPAKIIMVKLFKLKTEAELALEKQS